MTEKANKPWFEEIVHAVDNIQVSAKLKTFLDVEVYPEWLISVCAELFQQATPSTPIAEFKVDGPKSIGLWLGQNIANFYAMGEVFEKSIKAREQNADGLKKMLANLEANKTRPEIKNFFRVAEITGRLMMRLGKHAYDLEKMTLRAFKLALDQENYGEAVEFFNGFAKGISKKGLKGHRLARETLATKIYMAMFFNWQTVVRCDGDRCAPGRVSCQERTDFVAPILRIGFVLPAPGIVRRRFAFRRRRRVELHKTDNPDTVAGLKRRRDLFQDGLKRILFLHFDLQQVVAM
jgi:hypothetical protein